MAVISLEALEESPESNVRFCLDPPPGYKGLLLASSLSVSARLFRTPNWTTNLALCVVVHGLWRPASFRVELIVQAVIAGVDSPLPKQCKLPANILIVTWIDAIPYR